MNKLKIDDSTVVHCPTEELANQVLRIADELGYRWNTRKKYTEYNHWDEYEDQTCYYFKCGTYCEKSNFIENNNNIISAEEFIKLHTVMNEKTNLCELLKNRHEGKTFYSPLYGNIKLFSVSTQYAYPLWFKLNDGRIVTFDKYGFPDKNAVECLLFPSAEQRDWGIWDKEQKPIIPKTWSEIIEQDKQSELSVEIKTEVNHKTNKKVDASIAISPIEKSALVLLKTHQLIEIGYGGNVNQKDINYHTAGITSDLNVEIYEEYDGDFYSLYPFIFKSTKEAKEFIKEEENVKLVREYYQQPYKN